MGFGWAATLFVFGAAPPSAAELGRPNVVLIMTDDQGYPDFACHGNPVLKTPNLDGLHAQSVRWVNFHVDPTCSPTRSALMTGRYSSRTGVWHTIAGRSLLRRDETTLANLFEEAGYQTGIFGKWHLGDNYPYRPRERGFLRSLVHAGGGVGQTPDYWSNDYFDDVFRDQGVARPFQGYCTDVFTNAAIEFIEQNRDRPFFCYLATNAPHSPYNVAESYRRPYLDQGLTPTMASFYGMIANFDENLGRLLARLDALDLSRRTIVVFLTDNGSAAGFDPKAPKYKGFTAGMRGMKGSEYDGGHRVPCFWRWPGHLIGGRDIGRLAAHIDVLPTLVEMCQLKPAPEPRLDGISLAPFLRGEGTFPDRTVVVHSQRVENPIKWRKCAVMTDRWRLVNGEELFDMSADPGQEHDVAQKHPDVVRSLRHEYDLWWDAIRGRFEETCPIVLGDDHENPVHLCCHDWHGEIAPSSAQMLERNVVANGEWSLEFARPGNYRFTLLRRPKYVNHPLRAATARIRIGDREATSRVDENATNLDFTFEVPSGPTRLQTWLVDSDGTERGAYFVDVERLAP